MIKLEACIYTSLHLFVILGSQHGLNLATERLNGAGGDNTFGASADTDTHVDT